MEWLNQASGHKAIINQSDTRIAVDEPSHMPEAAILVRWHRRVYGERGPLYLERVCDEEGEPIGYRPIVGVRLLGNPQQVAAYQKLFTEFGTAEFRFKDAMRIYGANDDPTRKWLLKCQSAGLISQAVRRGPYKCTKQ